MKVIVAGGTGFIGKALTQALLDKAYQVIILTRSPEKSPSKNPSLRFVQRDPFRIGGPWEREVDGADVVINLAGESIAAKPWTPAQKKILLESRTRSVMAIYQAIEKAASRPKVLLNSSAVGYYGPCGDEILEENSKPGTGFLADLCRQWEGEVMKAEALNVRTIRLRTGLVLGRGGGVLAKMLPPFRLGIGGPLGDGKQWMSWIHLGDLTQMILFLIERPEGFGAFNATAMNPVRMNEFAKILGQVLRRPAFFRVPRFVLKIFIGEMSEMLLTGQCALPQRAIQLGFSFQYPALEPALQQILNKEHTPASLLQKERKV